MSRIAFILLMFLAGSHGMGEECYEIYDKICGDLHIDFEFPDNGVKLDRFCSQLIAIGMCRIEVQEKCEGEDEQHELRVFRKVMEYVEASCSLDNEIYKVVLNNLKCMKLSSEDVFISCTFSENLSKARADVLESYIERLNPERNTDLAAEKCVHGIWTSACTAITVGEMCGKELRDAILDILTNTEYSIRMFCSDAAIQLIPEFMEDFENANNEIEAQGNDFEDKK